MKCSWRKTILVMIMFFASSACSRGGDDSGARISIAPPREVHLNNTSSLNHTQTGASTQALARSLNISTTPEHIIINISGAGMSKIILNWDRQDNFGRLNPLPASFEFNETDYPGLKGPSRLVQYLAVYTNDQTDSLTFLYGDNNSSRVDIGSGATTVDLRTELIGTSDEEVEVAGQYVTSVNGAQGFGPTAKIEWRVLPPNGAPAMSILNFEMFNGWFQFFLIRGLKTQFFNLNTQTNLSGLDVASLENQIRSGTTQRLGKLSLPKRYFSQVVRFDPNTTTDTTEFYEQDGGEALIGFMGPSALSLPTTTLVSMSGVNNTSTASSELYATPSTQQPLMLKLGRAPASTLSIEVFWEQNASAQCSATQLPPLANQICFSDKNLRQGLYGVRGSYGPFFWHPQQAFTNPECSSISYSGLAGVCAHQSGGKTDLFVQWSYDPRTILGDAPIQGVHVLWGREAWNCQDNCGDDELRSATGDGYLCAEAIKDPKSFNLEWVKNFAVPSFKVSGLPTQNIKIPNVDLTSQERAYVLLCPYRGSQIYSTAARSYSYHSTSASNSISPPTNPQWSPSLLPVNGSFELNGSPGLQFAAKRPMAATGVAAVDPRFMLGLFANNLWKMYATTVPGNNYTVTNVGSSPNITPTPTSVKLSAVAAHTPHTIWLWGTLEQATQESLLIGKLDSGVIDWITRPVMPSGTFDSNGYNFGAFPHEALDFAASPDDPHEFFATGRAKDNFMQSVFLYGPPVSATEPIKQSILADMPSNEVSPSSVAVDWATNKAVAVGYQKEGATNIKHWAIWRKTDITNSNPPDVDINTSDIEEARKVILLPNGDFLALGYRVTDSNHDAIIKLIKAAEPLNLATSFVWQNGFAASNPSYDRAEWVSAAAMRKNNEDYIVAIGNTWNNSGGPKGLLIATSRTPTSANPAIPTFHIVHEHFTDGPGSLRAVDIIARPDDSTFYLTAEHTDGSQKYLRVYKIVAGI